MGVTGGGGGHSSKLQTKSQVSAVPGGGGGGGGCVYVVVVVIGPLARVSFRYVVFSVIQLDLLLKYTCDVPPL